MGTGDTAAASAGRGDNNRETDTEKQPRETGYTSEKPRTHPPPPFHCWCTYWGGVGEEVYASTATVAEMDTGLIPPWGGSSPPAIISASLMEDCINHQTAKAPSLEAPPPPPPTPRCRLNNRCVLVLICRHGRLQQRYRHKDGEGEGGGGCWKGGRGMERDCRGQKRDANLKPTGATGNQ